ncbi:Hypothetical predicted protein [Cloeon dipterum]|uniref:Uncharacterized protein n=1 Tax=Cloeon dipterum TaxID=197152 RepID=A0A8S1DSP5_9INSE|nr:Hypothetical predicted protein [Cloeon dipterum]
MEGVTLVEKTKWRLNGQKTLKDWAMKAVHINLHAFTQIQGGSYIQNKLSPQLRDEVLQGLLRSKRPEKTTTREELTSMKQSILVLMNKATKKLDLDLLMSLYPFEYDFNEVLKTVSIAAPNVRQLIIHFDNFDECFYDDLIRNTFINLLRSLKELKILKVIGIIDNYEEIALLQYIGRENHKFVSTSQTA